MKNIKTFESYHNFKKSSGFPGIDIEYNFDLLGEINGVDSYDVSKIKSRYLIKLNIGGVVYKYLFFKKNDKYCLKDFQNKEHMANYQTKPEYSSHESFDTFGEVISYIDDIV
jgi:hypothetical protein